MTTDMSEDVTMDELDDKVQQLIYHKAIDYLKGEEFLNMTNTTLKVAVAEPQKAPQWAKGEVHGIHYVITLDNDRGSYTFDYWGSVHDRQEIVKKHNIYTTSDDKQVLFWAKKEKNLPTAYNVIACLSLLYEDNFEDFCMSYGYDTDSITARETYQSVLEQDSKLRRMFTTDELELLEAIN